ncbi:GNAT family N-acetyltransferase [Ornithinimicrobium sp. LYQ103]|uniref:GNAT family N-acetyltransferase n=1 Tax=Ornithinimicrobium sp. LYQ103 TaxID=3378796 RepID=UPI003853831A
MPLHRLHDHAALVARSGRDPWLRWALDPLLPHEVWEHEGVALVERGGERRGVWVAPLGPGSEEGERVRSALTVLRDDGHLERLSSRSVSVPQEHAAVAHRLLDLGGGGDWEWMWTTREPPLDPREHLLVLLDDRRDAEEIHAFSSAHNPRVWTEVGTARVVRWVGLRDRRGGLVAVGGAELEASGAPHLAGVVTAVGKRGQGLGTVVSAALTRWALSEHGVCTLGMFSDNDPARSVYRRLGYRTARSWHSRTLVGAP